MRRKADVKQLLVMEIAKRSRKRDIDGFVGEECGPAREPRERDVQYDENKKVPGMRQRPL